MIQKYSKQDECLPEYDTENCKYYDIKHFIKRVEDILKKNELTKADKRTVYLLFLLSGETFFGPKAKGRSTEAERKRLLTTNWGKWESVSSLEEQANAMIIFNFIRFMAIRGGVSYTNVETSLLGYGGLIGSTLIAEREKVMCRNSLIMIKNYMISADLQETRQEAEKSMTDLIETYSKTSNETTVNALLPLRENIVNNYRKAYSYNVLIDMWADLLTLPELKVLKYDLFVSANEIKKTNDDIQELCNTVLGVSKDKPAHYEIGEAERKLAKTYKDIGISFQSRTLRPAMFDVTRAFTRFSAFDIDGAEEIDRDELEKIFYDMHSGVNRGELYE